MKHLFLFSLILASTSMFSTDGGKKPVTSTAVSVETVEIPAFVEVIVVAGPNQCGYLLQLNNGDLIQAVNLAPEFQNMNEKILVRLNQVRPVSGSSCNIKKEVHIMEIREYKPDPNRAVKFR